MARYGQSGSTVDWLGLSIKFGRSWGYHMGDTDYTDQAFSYVCVRSCSYTLPDLKHQERLGAPAFARNVK